MLPLALAVLVAGCGSDKKESVATAPAGSATTPPAATQALPPAVPPTAITQASWAPDALEELLAPIALYPDQLLTQILAASVNSQEVLDGGNWLLQNQNLSGDALDNAARTAGFGAAMRALVQFPQVVDMLCQQIDWTRQVGSAFSSDQKGVLDAVQRLRAQAAQVGNLKSTPEQTVETKVENNQTIVEVKPANPEVVYVPQYNPQVVYTTPPPAAPAPATTTTADDPNTVSTGAAVAGGLLAFGAGMLIGNAIGDDDDDDCCYPNWGHSTVVVGARPFYPPAYAYRPAYNSSFRPAYGYNPPAGYRNNYRNRSGNTTNINVNNSDYYNRFSNNQNLRERNVQSPLSGATQNRYGQGGNNRLAQSGNNRADSWKGQSSYKGARNDAATGRPNGAAGNRNKVGAGSENRANSMRLADNSDARNSFSRDSNSSRPTTHRSANADRGYGEGPRMQNRDTNVQRPAQAQTQHQPSRHETARDSAFSGASARDSGSFERSASARGRASAGGSRERGGGGGGGRRR
ncbi:MAG: DUF3300 domain-containing protein [Steroidobacteraceae bacterium]